LFNLSYKKKDEVFLFVLYPSERGCKGERRSSLVLLYLGNHKVGLNFSSLPPKREKKKGKRREKKVPKPCN